MRTRYFMVVATVLAGGCAALLLAVRPGSAVPGLSQLSNPGQRVAVSGVFLPRGKRASSAQLLGRTNGRTFYRIEGELGTCFGLGSATRGLGYVTCPKGHFPTSSYPVLAVPAVEGTSRTSRVARILSLDGFAADGVATVELLREGLVVGESAVSGNIFALDVAGTTLNGGTLRARDAEGDIVYERTYK